MEMFIATQEIFYGLGFLDGGVLATQLLQHQLRFWAGAMFLTSAGLTFTGIWRFFRSDRRCAPLRWIGAIWSVVLWSILTVHSPTLLMALICVTFALAEIRIMIAAWNRPWPTA